MEKYRPLVTNGSLEWISLRHKSLVFPSCLLWYAQDAPRCQKKKKKIQREVTSHVYMGLPNTISSPFPKMGARQVVGGVGRKSFAACDHLGLVCSSSSHRYHFYAFQSLLNYYQLPPNYASCHDVPWLPHWTTPLPLTSKGSFSFTVT